jgi:hypothetical protein
MLKIGVFYVTSILLYVYINKLYIVIEVIDNFVNN